MDRCWFLTSTTYGTWLPGDERGFVSRVRDHPDESGGERGALAPRGDQQPESSANLGGLTPPARLPRRKHNTPRTPVDPGIPGLRHAARDALKGPPIYFTREHAEVLFAQFQETAGNRQWILIAVGIMANHFHILVGVCGDPDPHKVLGDFKSYGSRALNCRWGKPAGETWWTDGGSTRKKTGEAAIREAIEYIRNQPYPLLIWINPDFDPEASGGR